MAIKNLLGRSSLYLAIGFAILILVLSLVKLQNMPDLGGFRHLDKIKHMFAYSILSFFWLLSCQLGKIKIKYLHLIAVMIVYGVIIEILQSSLTSYRTGDLLDILANTTGILLGYLVLKLVSRYYLQV